MWPETENWEVMQTACLSQAQIQTFYVGVPWPSVYVLVNSGLAHMTCKYLSFCETAEGQGQTAPLKQSHQDLLLLFDFVVSWFTLHHKNYMHTTI